MIPIVSILGHALNLTLFLQSACVENMELELQSRHLEIKTMTNVRVSDCVRMITIEEEQTHAMLQKVQVKSKPLINRKKVLFVIPQ